MRAFEVVKCQFALVCRTFRSCYQAAISSMRVCLSGMRRSRHMPQAHPSWSPPSRFPLARAWLSTAGCPPHWARRENMANDLRKRANPTAPKQTEDAASRLKSDLMKDALGRMFGEDGEKTVPSTPRVILALANHAQTAGWDRAKVLQRGMFKA